MCTACGEAKDLMKGADSCLSRLGFQRSVSIDRRFSKAWTAPGLHRGLENGHVLLARRHPGRLGDETLSVPPVGLLGPVR